jgi:type IV pilus assembly protein PilQ
MKSVLRYTLLAAFAAAGIGAAVWIALRPTPFEVALPGLVPRSTLSHQSAWPRKTVTRTASETQANAFRPQAPQEATEQEAAHDHKLEPVQQVSLRAPTPVIAPAAPTESPYQLTMAHQMGRLEEKLRQAEAFAERQQRSLEATLTAFQERQEASARAAVLRRQELPLPLDAATRQENSGAGLEYAPQAEADTNAVAANEPLPPPASQAPEISPDEGDGRLTLNLRNSDLRQVLELLSDQHGLNLVASQTVQGTVTAKLTDVDADTALDAVLKATGFVARREGDVIYVATPQEFLEIDHAHDHIGTRVYRPNYITAAEMEKLLTPLMTASVGVISVSTPAKIGIPANNADAGGDAFGGAEVVLVQDYESVLKRVDQLLLEVDVRPLQVSIEAMIITVTLDDRNEMGVNFALLEDNAVLVSGAPVQELATIPFDGGLKFGFLDSSLAGFIQALETVGDTNVVAAPRVMVLNKQRAEILIGSQLGYVSTTVTENAATQAVEFLEVGTQLRIRPFISSDGMIRLEVHPELSTGEVNVQAGFTLPNKSVTQVTTNIMCHDGATVVIGGLIREDLSSNSTQIPVLGSVPYVGALFRQRNEELSRTETLVVLTPRIVSAHAAAAEGAQGKSDYLRRQDWRYDKMNPLAQRYYGKQYLRKARAAWNAGDASVALRYSNLAIHFDPENLEAMNLRADIAASSPYGDGTVETHLREGLAPWGHPLREYSRHGSPWQPYDGPPEMLYEPPEPGVPGKIGGLDPPYPLPLGPAAPLSPPLPPEEVPGVVVPEVVVEDAS